MVKKHKSFFLRATKIRDAELYFRILLKVLKVILESAKFYVKIF